MNVIRLLHYKQTYYFGTVTHPNSSQLHLPDSNALLIERLTQKINLFIADDDEHLCKMLIAKLFTSPLFNCTYATSISETFRFIKSTKRTWHCWILDMGFQNNELGTQILENFSYFSFSVVLSAQRSMNLAAEAVAKGAIAVFDKDPQMFFAANPFFLAVCRTAALSYILNGKKTDALGIFKKLGEKLVKSPEDWAEIACVSLRRLEEVCTQHAIPSPRYLIPFYYTLCALLSHGAVVRDREKDFYTECIGFTAKYFDKISAEAE